jgi:hypothetical protein
MRILWNAGFQAEFSQTHWQQDLDAVKAAGFKTSGPPDWLWRTQKASVLNALKELKPQSGIRITPEALEKYKPLNERETKNAELKAGLKKALKELKKEADKNDPTTLYDYTEKGYLVSSDLPPMPPFVPTFKASPIPKERCMICDDPMWYPFNDKDICLWCEKELDNEKKVCENTLARENL